MDAPLLFFLVNRGSAYLVWSVGVGVGLAVMCGMLRFLYGWSIKPFLIALSVCLLIISVFAYFNPNLVDVTGVAWDCGGVTTGPVTVPLVLAMGLGIGGQMGVVEGFGILSMASICPILTILAVGMYVKARRRAALRDVSNASAESVNA